MVRIMSVAIFPQLRLRRVGVRMLSGEHVSINFLGTPLAFPDDIRKSAIHPSKVAQNLSLTEYLTAPQHQEGHLTLHIICLYQRSHDPDTHTLASRVFLPRSIGHNCFRWRLMQSLPSSDMFSPAGLCGATDSSISRLRSIFTARSPAEHEWPRGVRQSPTDNQGLSPRVEIVDALQPHPNLGANSSHCSQRPCIAFFTSVCLVECICFHHHLS